ncbi:glycosyl hydrolase family 65 protein [Plantibacter sp. ME-Dv--P-095]|uniref:glycoside hydrolase family 65 protein n=1 Tax=Plantibacter sp. ME-Dv--P-095 TaxID=3040299 RepID=UPI00254E638F|nr:glycosyl hydrolase family 65 protein [Plantibacter sp. ME-Dv--P-095]
MNHITSDPLDRHRFPLDDWALVETHVDADDEGTTETLFALGNGYLGFRGNVEEGRDGHVHGTFINGFHETWPIRHAEEAFGFARVGQTIVNAPDTKVVRLYVDDEPLILNDADLLSFERRLDFKTGVLSRELEWRTPSGKRVHIRSRRMVSFTDRHLAVLDYEVTLLDADASLVLSSQIINRQDRQDDYLTNAPEPGMGDPRKAESLTERVLQPRYKLIDGPRAMLGYQTTNSGMTIVAGADHTIETDNEYEVSTHIEADLAKHVYTIRGRAGVPTKLTKIISYHTSNAVPPKELADRCARTLDRSGENGIESAIRNQELWLEDFWARSDVEVHGQPAVQQATRWNLFQLAQATARTDGGGVAAKGVSGSGYGGHYFWDTEIYVLPFLSYTAPLVARNALRFRQNMLDAARSRATELNQHGALFPWRTINGLESSAYYAAGTAQYHIDADISYALRQYVAATGDEDFLARGAVDIFVETARMWADLGFWRANGKDSFHIYGVTGPDEYTTVVNDNLYTNVMARSNLLSAVEAVERLRADDPASFGRLVSRLSLDDAEIAEWQRAAEHMHIPFDKRLGIHPQDAQFLEKELWDLDHTPPEHLPLLLHFHPLVIYRFQVLKQADVVLALLLQGDHFTDEEKLADFDYYDPLTTGDSTLSAVVQSIIAAEVGYQRLALKYFWSALFVDLANLHRNTPDGVHVASTGGVWSALVLGFAGMRDHGGVISFSPRLPVDWQGITFRLTVKETRVRISVRRTEMRFTVEEGDSASFVVAGGDVLVEAGTTVTVPLDNQGPHLVGEPSASDIEGSRRADGSLITVSMPTIALGPADTESIPIIQPQSE